jgi:CHAT domain-containing protein/tetratricopeptide (TPR) repeat protein
MLTLVAGWCAVAAEDPPKELPPEERKELEAKWKELNEAGLKHYRADKVAEAAEAFEKALATARRLYPKQDHADLARSLNNLAGVLNDQRKYAEAEALHREALAMRRRLYPKQDHPHLAQSLHNLAAVLESQGKYADAEPLSREALEMYRRLYPNEDRHELATVLDNLAAVLKDQRKYADAEPLCREALEMRRRLYPKQDHTDLAASLTSLAAVLQARGKYADAEALYREALAMNRRLYPKQDHTDLADSLTSLALVLTDQGKFADAEPLCREALEMRRRLYPKQDHTDLDASLNNLAGVLQAQGKYADAEPLCREALAMCRRLYPKQDHPDLASSLNNLAALLKLQGKYADAEPLCREALEMRRRLYRKQDHADLASSLHNLATVLQARGKYADAEALYRDALAMNRRLYPKQDHPDLAMSLTSLAVVLDAQGKYAEAEPLCRDALAMNRRLYPKQDHPDLAMSLNNLAAVLNARGQSADAEPLYREALKMYRALGEADAAVRFEGDALTLTSTYPLVRENYLKNARALQADPAAVYAEVWASKAALTRVYERRALAARAAASDPKAAALLDQLTDRRRRRADLLLAPIPTDQATRTRRDDDLDRYAREIEELARNLSRLLPSAMRSDKLAKSTPTDLQKLLPADAAVVDFLGYNVVTIDPRKPGLEGETRTLHYLAFVVTKDKVSWLDLGPAKPLEDAITAWREAITAGKDIPPELPKKVRELAWAKVRKELPDKVKVVYISPDLALCRVPWAALPGDKDKTILLEDYAVAVIPHTVFLLDKLWPQDPVKNRSTGVLAVGGVSYDADPPQPGQVAVHRGDPILKPDQKLKWDALPGAAAEAKGVTGAADKKKLDARTLDGDKATAAAVLAALPQARYAHLATHGFFADPSFRSAFHVDPELFKRSLLGERVGPGALSPMVMTGLVFAGANNPKTPGRGVVTGEALVDLDLSGLELAVLSACETGLGDVADGEGTFGLQRALHLAGTRDVVASLWKVPDRPTAALMALFYRNLWDKDLPPVEALRQAQLEIYRHPDRIAALAEGFRGPLKEVPGTGDEVPRPGADGKAHPWLWAAFTLSGPGR